MIGTAGDDKGVIILNVEAILFDLDGTLVDSTYVVERLWREWAKAHGIPPEELLAVSHGRPAIDTMRQFRPDLANLREMAAAHIAAEEADTTPLPAIPGASELLASLPADRWAIVTSCPPVLARVRREAAGLPGPRVLVTGADIERGKPDPDCFLLAARKLNAAPGRCLVVEDSPAGARAGKTAGMPVLALTTTHRAQDVEADWHLPNLLGVQARSTETGLEIRFNSRL